MQPEQLVLRGTIHDTKSRKFKNIWVEGGFTLFVPLWRYDLLDLGEIEVPEYRIEASELLSRIEDYYKQPVSLAFLDAIERRDPTAEEELEEYREQLLQGKRVTIGDLVRGLMFMEGIGTGGQGGYQLLLGS
ncbi:hypothetical protein [Cedratvirus kamchatka]|uniref:Uncharacterized protein n=1 Tax=Cedratvirus kamchatka TaxID=2716914 RepID=A0A6G8MZ00_9VIRU|nr:hypothetical protein [Cedratvirus kamchatka]